MIFGGIALDDIHCNPFCCFEGYFNDHVAMSSLSRKRFSYFFREHISNSLCVRGIFSRLTGIQQKLIFLSSLCSVGCVYSKQRQVVSSKPCDPPELSSCSGIPCSFVYCCLGCYKGCPPSGFQRLRFHCVESYFLYMKVLQLSVKRLFSFMRLVLL